MIMKKLSYAILVLIGLFCVMSLTGCAKTPVETVAESIEEQITSLENTLPKECKNEAVVAQIESLRAENKVAQAVCETEINNIQLKYERVLTILLVVLGVFFAKFYIKK